MGFKGVINTFMDMFPDESEVHCRNFDREISNVFAMAMAEIILNHFLILASLKVC